MKKFLSLVFALAIILATFYVVSTAAASTNIAAPLNSTAAELIDQVNKLRVSESLPPYQENAILDGTAQAQAEYIMAIGVFTHIGPDGTHPFQRALNAGYPVAGDLTRGGFFSENVCGGTLQTAYQAVQVWMGDAPHQNTMLSKIMKDVGAGVAVNGNTYYYALDAGLSTGSSSSGSSGSPKASTATATVPAADTATPQNTATLSPTMDLSMMITYTVKAGDTLTAISKAFNVPLQDLLTLNNMSLDSIIYVGDQIIIGAKPTLTPTVGPTATFTLLPTNTELPTLTLTPLEPTVPATPAPAPRGFSVPPAAGMISLGIGLALGIFGLVAMVRSRRN